MSRRLTIEQAKAEVQEAEAAHRAFTQAAGRIASISTQQASELIPKDLQLQIRILEAKDRLALLEREAKQAAWTKGLAAGQPDYVAADPATAAAEASAALDAGEPRDAQARLLAGYEASLRCGRPWLVEIDAMIFEPRRLIQELLREREPRQLPYAERLHNLRIELRRVAAAVERANRDRLRAEQERETLLDAMEEARQLRHRDMERVANASAAAQMAAIKERQQDDEELADAYLKRLG